MHVYLDQTIRMYSLLALVTITSWYCLFHLANRDGNQRWHTVGYILSTGMVAWLHYFGAFTVASHLLAVAYWHHKRDHSHVFPALAGGLMLAAPAMATTAYFSFTGGGQAQRMITHTDAPPDIRKLGVIIGRLVAQRVNNTAEAITIAAVLGGLAYTVRHHASRLELAGIMAWFWTPVLLMVAVSWLIHPADGARYIIASSPALLLAYTYSVRELLPRWLHATAALLTIGLWSTTLWLVTHGGRILA